MKKEVSCGGISFLGVLTIVFIILKLTKTINWSWWWVLAPVWGQIAISLAIAFLVSILEEVGEIIEKEKRR